MFDDFSHADKMALVSTLLRVMNNVKEEDDLFVYVCAEVSRGLRCHHREVAYELVGEAFEVWAAEWMDRNLINQELLDQAGSVECLHHRRVGDGILAYHPQRHITSRHDVPVEWATEKRLMMIRDALDELGYTEADNGDH
jgi:hypothetical protein